MTLFRPPYTPFRASLPPPLTHKQAATMMSNLFSPSPHPSQQPLTITTMACKFIVNSAFEARLLRPSHQRTILFETIHKPGCSVPGRPILRSYSESTPVPPLPKISGSHDGSQYSGPDDKNLF